MVRMWRSMSVRASSGWPAATARAMLAWSSAMVPLMSRGSALTTTWWVTMHPTVWSISSRTRLPVNEASTAWKCVCRCTNASTSSPCASGARRSRYGAMARWTAPRSGLRAASSARIGSVRTQASKSSAYVAPARW